MEYGDAGLPGCRIQPLHDPAELGRRGIARRGQHDGHGGVGCPVQRSDLGEPPGRRGAQQRAQRCAQPGQHDLRLGVAEARVELDHPHASRRQREPGVQQTGEGSASARHLLDRRHEHGLEHLVDEIGRRPGQRGVGTHATGVRAGVTVADALEVLRRRQRHHGRAVGQGEQRHLRAVEELLDDDPPAGSGVAQRPRHGRR